MGAVALNLYILGEPVSWTWAKAIGVPITVVGIAILAFERWLWRIPLLQGWFVYRPNLNGTWEVTLETDWVDERTGQRRAPVEARFEIRQTHSRLHIAMSSDESMGELVAASIIRRDDGRYRLTGTFRNEPRLSNRDRSPIHYGAFLLDVEGSASRPDTLRGHYWNDRGSKGEMAARREGTG